MQLRCQKTKKEQEEILPPPPHLLFIVIVTNKHDFFSVFLRVPADGAKKCGRLCAVRNVPERRRRPLSLHSPSH